MSEKVDMDRREPSGADRSEPAQWRPDRNFWIVLSALMLTMLLSSMDQTVFSSALPTVVGELHGLEHMAWVTTAYTLAATIGMPLYGKFGDAIGHKRAFVVGLGLFITGSLVAGAAQSMAMLIVGRAIQGLGGGGLMITSFSIIGLLVPAQQRAKYSSPMGAMFGVGAVVGPLLGGWLTDAHSWRWALWINVPLGLIALFAALRGIQIKQERQSVRVDVWGILTMAVAVTSLILAASWGGGQYEWISPQILGLAALSIIAWIAFVVREHRAEDPLMSLGMFRNKTFVLTTSIAILLVGIANFAVVMYMPSYLQMSYGVTAMAAGLLMLPMSLGMVLTTMVSGAIIARSGYYRGVVMTGIAIGAIGIVLLSVIGDSASLWVAVACTLPIGIAMGTMIQNLMVVVQDQFDLRETGRVTSAFNFFREIGATLGIALVGSLFASRLGSYLTPGALGDAASFMPDDPYALTPELVRQMPDAAQNLIAGAYSDALLPIYGWGVVVFIAGFVLTVLLPSKPLSSGSETVPVQD